jgi:hypothetical protein
MAYTLQYSLGTLTVADTTINSQTSLNLPGRNYAGYGAPVDQNQLSILENFASFPIVGPTNPIPGQTWYDTATGTLNVNTSANSLPSWTEVIVNSGNANVDAGNITVSGTLTTDDITTGGALIPGTMTGAWSMTAGSSFYAPTINAGALTTTVITTGAVGTAGSMTGQWTLTAGSTLNATYADYAERFEADAEYDAGTVMEMGGSKEITAARGDLSEEILGVVSTTAGMTMNSAAGTQKTHPAIAMAGRVPVKVRGVVRKGNRLVSAGGGYARAAKSGEATAFNTIGRSLEDKLTESEGKVLAAVSAKL